MKRFIRTIAVAGILLGAAAPAAAFADGPQVTDPPQQQPTPSTFATQHQSCLGPLRSGIAQGELAGVGPFGEHFTGTVNPGAHYGTVGEQQFLNALGVGTAACP